MKWSPAWATRPARNEQASGDAVICRQDGDKLLVGIVDALGHGEAADQVAKRAVAAVMNASANLGVREVLELLDAALNGTRGAAATFCLLQNGELEAGGVGNVELRALPSVPLILSPGILGARVRKLKLWRGVITPGTRLVISSDGISRRTDFFASRQLPPQRAADLLLAEHSHMHDDATVLVVDAEES